VIVRQELRALAAAGELELRRGDVLGGRGLLLEVERRTALLGLVSVLARTRRALRGLDSERTRSSAERRALSPREAQILELIARGRSSKRIGAQLGLSSRTIDTHICAAMNKLGASTRIQAAALARLSSSSAARASRPLSPEEARLLGLLVDGRTVSEAAELLGLSRRTATRRLERVRRELGVATNAQATILSVPTSHA
jgi:DNA-binding NarL/FixJ family response regulator